MDPIEIFELRAYIIDATQSDPAGSAFLSEIRSYAVLAVGSKDATFISEMRAYAIAGNSKDRPAVHTTCAYAIVRQGSGAWHQTGSSSFLIRKPGIAYGKGSAYSITQSPSSAGYINGSVRVKDDGLSYAKGTLYTIEIP